MNFSGSPESFPNKTPRTTTGAEQIVSNLEDCVKRIHAAATQVDIHMDTVFGGRDHPSSPIDVPASGSITGKLVELSTAVDRLAAVAARGA